MQASTLGRSSEIFGLIMAGFFTLLITPLVIVLKSKGITTGALITALLTTLVELVSAIIVLPKIIAEYLFNKEEDKNMMEIIKSMQTYNEKKQDYIERQK
jgi:predicted PurR-regulated permease PerM